MSNGYINWKLKVTSVNAWIFLFKILKNYLFIWNRPINKTIIECCSGDILHPLHVNKTCQIIQEWSLVGNKSQNNILVWRLERERHFWSLILSCLLAVPLSWIRVNCKMGHTYGVDHETHWLNICTLYAITLLFS